MAEESEIKKLIKKLEKYTKDSNESIQEGKISERKSHKEDDDGTRTTIRNRSSKEEGK